MFVAANFPKEVTNTALWLLGQGISIQCFRVTPYVFGEEALLSIDQIIPTPEAKEFMIIMKAKEKEEKSTEAVLKDRHRIRLDFWEKTLESFRNSDCKLLQLPQCKQGSLVKCWFRRVWLSIRSYICSNRDKGGALSYA